MTAEEYHDLIGQHENMSPPNLLHPTYASTTSRDVAVCAMSFCSILSGLLCAVGIYRFWRLRSEPVIQKRHPLLVLITCLSLIAFLIVERPLAALSTLSRFASVELHWLQWILRLILGQTLYICLLTRIYITLCDVMFAKAMAQRVWIKHIDTSIRRKTSFMVSRSVSFKVQSVVENYGQNILNIAQI